MTRATRLTFADHPCVQGWQFSGGKTTRALVMNLNPQDCSPNSAKLAQFQAHITQLSTAPAATASEIKQTNPQPSPELTLPAWSLTLMR